MIAGQIVAVNWRDALPNSSEANKSRPGIVVSSPQFFGRELPFEIVVPLTGAAALAIKGASVLIQPTPENRCTKPSYALAWNVQAVPHARITETSSKVTAAELRLIRKQISDCVEAG